MLDKKQLQELLLQSLEHERGGVKVYQTALESASCEDLKKEWTKYLSQTRKHVQILEGVLQKFEIDPEQETAGREIVEEEEDEHLYHSTGWARELWLDSLGLTAVLPPPEEQKDVKTAMGAARAKQQSEQKR
jgi:rubrerythrin